MRPSFQFPTVPGRLTDSRPWRQVTQRATLGPAVGHPWATGPVARP